MVRRFPVIILKTTIEWFSGSSFHNKIDKNPGEVTIAEVEWP